MRLVWSATTVGKKTSTKGRPPTALSLAKDWRLTAHLDTPPTDSSLLCIYQREVERRRLSVRVSVTHNVQPGWQPLNMNDKRRSLPPHHGRELLESHQECAHLTFCHQVCHATMTWIVSVPSCSIHRTWGGDLCLDQRSEAPWRPQDMGGQKDLSLMTSACADMNMDSLFSVGIAL